MIARLQCWSLFSKPPGEWEPPEKDGVRVFGFVFGHPRHLDGKELLTSPVLRCCANRIVTRSGSEYELGSIDPAYERRYPGSLRRLCVRLDPDSKDEAQRCASWRDACVSRVRKFLASLACKQRPS
jgi:hypothetical protein